MSSTVASDQKAMTRAIALGEKARVIAPPNPWVGCVLTQKGRIVGEGHTQSGGTPHAETIALEAAGDRAKGSTVYLSLEPCSHYGRTPPCAKALIQAKVARVVIAIEDPDSRVNGRGVRLLRDAGIQVDTGIEAAAASQSLEAYLWHRKTGMPYCLAKAAISIDGRIAAADRTSQWITSPEARLDAHRLRAESQAVLIGAGTAVSDKPALTVRHVEELPIQQPLRVVLDSTGRVLPPSPLFDTAQAATLMLTTAKCPAKAKNAWTKAGVEIVVMETKEGRINEGRINEGRIDEGQINEGQINLKTVLKLLGKRGIIQVLVEGGSMLMSNLLQQHLINRLVLYMGPCILGDKGLPLFANMNINTLDDALKMHLLQTKQIGDCFRVDYTPE